MTSSISSSLISTMPVQTNIYPSIPICMRSIVNKVVAIWSVSLGFVKKIGFTCFSYKTLRPILAPSLPPRSIKQMQETYSALGPNKWKEFVDGIYHKHGKMVFDQGLHKSTVEPGYIGSIEKAGELIKSTLGQPLTPQLYLKVHKVACAHFEGEKNGTLMGQEKVGVFRGYDDSVCTRLSGQYAHTLSPEAIKRFSEKFGSVERTKDKIIMHHKVMTRNQIEKRLSELIQEYYNEIKAAKTEDEKLLAIAKFLQHHEWLHPVRDGSGRTGMLLAGKILVENGFHPPLLDLPYFSGTKGLSDWCNYLKEGLVAWKREAALQGYQHC